MKTKITLSILLILLAFIRANSQFLFVDSIQVENALSCRLCNGSAFPVNISGFPPYTYSWSNGETSKKDTDLCPGKYKLFVTDSHGDTGSEDFVVGPTLLATTTYNIAACSSNNGMGSVSVSGGVSPYTYLWSNGATTSAISGLSAGVYLVTVMDVGGCIVTDSITIIHGLTVTAISANVTCNGNNNGSASVTGVTGGVSPFTYLWMPSLNTNSNISGLSPGTYTVTVTDNNGCTGTAIVLITQPTVLMLDTNFFDSAIGAYGATCGMNNGTAWVTGVIGGTLPYTYSWAPGGGNSDIVYNLTAGSYTCYVTDINGCSLSETVVVPYIGPVPSINPGYVTCYGDSNGFADITSVSGGVSPYTYDWAPTGATTSSVSGLSSGYYTVTVTDKNGCSGTTLVYIYQPSPITFTIDTVPDTGSCSGSAIIQVNGGWGSYNYSWTPFVNNYLDSMFFSDVADSLCFGVYELCVTDGYGCTACDSIHIRHAVMFTGITEINGDFDKLKIYPVPASSELWVQTKGNLNGNYNMSIYDMMGREVVKIEGTCFISDKPALIDVSKIPTGSYLLRIYGNNFNKSSPFTIEH